MFNNSSLFHVGYFTLTLHLHGRLLEKHARPVTSPDVCLRTTQLCYVRAHWPGSDVPAVPRRFVFQSKQRRPSSILIRTEQAAVRAAQIG